MSTQMNQYLGYGYLLPYNETNMLLENKYTEDGKEEMLDKYHDSAFKEIVEIDGCSMIVDGMNGKYIFFGKILKKSPVYQPLNTMEIPKISSKIKKNVIEQHNKIFNVENKNPQMILLSHYR